MAAELRTFSCTPNKTLKPLPSVAGTLTRGLTHFVRILAHVLAPQSLALCAQGTFSLETVDIECEVEVSLIELAMKNRWGYRTGISPNHWIPGRDYAFIGKLNFIGVEILEPGRTCRAIGGFVLPKQDLPLIKNGFTWHICEAYTIVGYVKVVSEPRT